MSDFMARLARHPEQLRVVELSDDGIVLEDTTRGMNYVVSVIIYEHLEPRFDLRPQPAWPAIEERELRNALATVYDPSGVDAWVRSARRRGLRIEEAKTRASQLIDGAYA